MRTRVIPCLSIRDGALVKTVKFRSPIYVGDPINAVRIFNDKEVDELFILDISDSRADRGPDYEMIERIVAEAFIPVAYGGGLTTMEQARRVMDLGVEKLVLNTVAIENPGIVRDLAATFGSQAVVVAIDFKRTLFRGVQAMARSGRKNAGLSPLALAQQVTENGAGEILLTSVDRDGTGQGYDLDLIATIASAVCIPIVACGGAGNLNDLTAAVAAGASAVAAGSMFMFYGPHRAVLINYPDYEKLESLFR